MSKFFFAEAVSIFIKNRAVRQNIHWQNVIFNCHRIFKLAFAFKKLAQAFHYVICNFALRCFKCRIDNWQIFVVVPCGNSSFADRISKNAIA